MLSVQIIVLNYDGKDVLPLCLPSLVEAAKRSIYPTGVTVLDNRSRDGSPEWVRAHFPDVRLVVARENRFLVSFNDIVRQIDDEIVILMNNDIRVDADFVDPLARVFEEYADAFLASPRVLDFGGNRYEGGRTRAKIHWGLFWSNSVFPSYETLQDKPGYTLASGFGAFHRKRFLSLGGYDDLYLPGIMEDADLGFRAWREGYRSYYVPQSRVYHMGQASFRKAFGKSGIQILAHRNAFLFIWKNLSDPSLLTEHFLFLIPRVVFALIKGRTELAAGFFQALLRLPEAIKRRKTFPKRARSDREIFSMANGETVPRRYLFKKRWKRIAIALFDGIGSILFSFPSLFIKKPGVVSPNRILVIRADSIGDAVLTLPALKILKDRFPDAEIDFLVSLAIKELYSLFFPSAKFILFEGDWAVTAKKLRMLHYDLGIDFRGDLRNILLMSLSGIRHRWGRSGTGGGFLLTHRIGGESHGKHEVLKNTELVQKNGASSRITFPSVPPLPSRGEAAEGKKIVIHLGAGYPSKRWAAINFIELARRIQEKKLGTPIFVGTEEEKGLTNLHRNRLGSNLLDLMGKTSLPELLSILARADLFIGNDSGPAHLAALLDRKILLIFSGTNDFRQWAPWSSQLRVLSHSVPCSPCEERICPLKRQVCLEEISVNEVFCAVEEMLAP